MTDWPGTQVQAWPGAPVPKNNPLPPPAMEAGERFLTGVADPLVGGRQLFTHLTGSPESIKAMDEAVTNREEEIRKRDGGGFVRGAGAAVGGAPLLAVGPLGGLTGAAIGGALAGTLEPTPGDNYWEKKTNQALMGTAFGSLGGGATRMMGTAAGPTVREAAAALMKAGVKLTPGQIAGGVLRRAEEAAKSLPILGTFIRGAEGRSIESFNRAAIDQALEPIGIKLPATANPGHEAITYGRMRLDEAYDNLLPKMQLVGDQILAKDIADTRFLASDLPKAQAEQFEKIVANKIAKPFLDTGSIGGKKLKEMESELGRLASSYKSSSDAGQREMGRLLDDLRGAVRDGLARQNPMEAAELKKINEAYAMWTRIESAASRGTTKAGVFTPSDLLQAIKNADKSARKAQFARGDAIMQDFAEFGQMVLPAKMPDSGTPERAMWDMLMLGGGAAAGTASHTASPYVIPALAGMTGASAVYTKPAIDFINKVAPSSARRAAIGSGIREISPYAGTASEPILKQIANE